MSFSSISYSVNFGGLCFMSLCIQPMRTLVAVLLQLLTVCSVIHHRSSYLLGVCHTKLLTFCCGCSGTNWML